MGAIVDHGAEDFAAGAVRHRVIHEQRGVGVLLAVEQIDAVGLDLRALAGKRDGRLVAADAGARHHAKRVEMRMRAQRHHGRGNVEGVTAVLVQADMVEA